MHVRDHVRPASTWWVRCACTVEFLAGTRSKTQTACMRLPWPEGYAARACRSAAFRVWKIASVPSVSSLKRPLLRTAVAPFPGDERSAAMFSTAGTVCRYRDGARCENRGQISNCHSRLKCEVRDATRHANSKDEASKPRQQVSELAEKAKLCQRQQLRRRLSANWAEQNWTRRCLAVPAPQPVCDAMIGQNQCQSLTKPGARPGPGARKCQAGLGISIYRYGSG